MSAPRAFRGLLVLGLCSLVGCSLQEGRAKRYRAETMLYDARRDDAEARVGGSRPDSAALIRLRDSYGRLRREMKPPFVPGDDAHSRRLAGQIGRQVGQAELEAARLAMQARNPTLALESARWVASIAGADTGLQRESDLSAMLALRALRRFDEAVDLMHSMLDRYPPASPPDPSREDMILKIPDAIVALRQDQGDTAAVRAELSASLRYYRSALARRPPPILEQQLRVRIVRTLLELGGAREALAELTRLERLVITTPALSTFAPEILHSKARVQGMLGKDLGLAISLYDRVADTYPGSPFAPMSLVDGGVLEERRGNLKEAVQRYRRVLAVYPKDEGAAPIALFRLAMVQELSGDWESAKQALESLPVRYPHSRAAAEAPLAVVGHYRRVRDREAQRAALDRAISTYRRLVARDSSAAVTTLFRWNIVRAQIASERWEAALATIDEIAVKDRGTGLAAQALIEGARLARAIGDRPRSEAYLQRFRLEYPGAKIAIH